MATKQKAERVEITKVANGYMVRDVTSTRMGDCASLEQMYVFNEFDKAAQKAVEMLGDVDS